MSLDAAQVLARRVAAQRLVGPPCGSAAEVVRLLAAVQSQELGHALWSLAMRTDPTRYADLVAAYDAGELLRTHLLRPTWHLVDPADLGWMLALTSPRVHARSAGMYRQTGVDREPADRVAERLIELLAGGRYLTRPEIGAGLAAAGIEGPTGMRLGYLVMRAELDGVLVSGPLRGAQPTYALVTERLAGRAVHTPDDPAAALWRRFVAARGPVSVRDFARWSSLTLTTARAAAARSADVLERVETDGEELWLDPAAPADAAVLAAAAKAVRLLPLYDELTLSHTGLRFGTAAGHPHPPDADTRHGPVLAGLTDVGTWRRTLVERRDRSVRLAVRLAPASRRHVPAVDAELHRLAAFLQARPEAEEWEQP